MFPEPVHYSRTDSPGWKIKDWETANCLLGYLEPIERPFAIFALPDESYVQCLGKKTRLTVEARVCNPDGTFVHYVFGKGPPVSRVEVIEVSTGTSEVDATQVLAMRDARLIIRQFLETRTFPAKYQAQDVTAKFTNSH